MNITVPKGFVPVEYHGEVYSYTDAELAKRKARKVFSWLGAGLALLVIVFPVSSIYVAWMTDHFRIVGLAVTVCICVALWKVYEGGCTDGYKAGWNEAQDFWDAWEAKRIGKEPGACE